MSTVTSKLNIGKVGRVCVTVADTDRALDFYIGKLGFEKVVDEPMGPDMRWVEVAVAWGETTIALARPRRAARPAASRPGSSSTPTDSRRHACGVEGGRRGRRRGGHALRRLGAADVLAPRPGRQLTHRRPAVELITSWTCGRSTSWRASGSARGAPRPRAARALGAARPLRVSRGGREARTRETGAACRGRTSARRSGRSDTSGTISTHG